MDRAEGWIAGVDGWIGGGWSTRIERIANCDRRCFVEFYKLRAVLHKKDEMRDGFIPK